MLRPKHRRDYNHGKSGWVGGNQRHGKSRGFRRGQRAALNTQLRKDVSQ